MKKNISINIGGIIFHIEEDGYERLRKYLDSVNKYFASFEDSSEILADIEGRIAEIFLAKLNEGKQVITADDVTSLIATMGSVSDFKAAEEQEFATGDSTVKTAMALIFGMLLLMPIFGADAASTKKKSAPTTSQISDSRRAEIRKLAREYCKKHNSPTSQVVKLRIHNDNSWTVYCWG